MMTFEDENRYNIDAMLRFCLSTIERLTNRFGCAVVRVYAEHEWYLVQAFPEEFGKDSRYIRFLEQKPVAKLWQQLNTSPSGYSILRHDADHVHVFLLPDYGLLIVFTHARPLSDVFSDSFQPVAASVAQNFRAFELHAELEKWSRFERSLTHWSIRFMTVSEEHLDTLLQAALAELGLFVQADRAFLFAYDFANNTATNTHEWCANGISRELENLQQVSLEGLDEWVKAHQSGHTYLVTDVSSLEPKDYLRQVLEAQQIQSNITIPLMGPAGCFGFVGFDAVRQCQHWDKIDEAILRTMADMFANAEIKRKQQEQIRKTQQELTHAMQKAAALAHEAADASKAKSSFMAMVSHEVRTPLAAMLGMSELLLDTSLNERQYQYAYALKRSSEILRGIVNDILDFSVSESGQGIKLQTELIQIPKLLRESLELMEIFANDRNNHLYLILAPDVPEYLYVDALRLRQIIWNILGNANKYTENGSIEVNVSSAQDTTLAPHRCRLLVKITDTGAGMDAQALENLFKPFHASEHSSMTRLGGTGLGLSIIKHLVQAIGGDIEIRSQLEQGTQVVFWLDLERGEAPRLSVCDTRHRRDAGETNDAARTKVLIVDDNTEIREVVAETLISFGCDVYMASQGIEAISMIEHDTFDLVLMDCQMPVMNGLQATRIIRSRQLLPAHVPIIALTAAVMKENIQDYDAAGMNDWLTKPYTRKELERILNRWVKN